MNDATADILSSEMASVLCYTKVPEEGNHDDSAQLSPVGAIRDVLEHCSRTIDQYRDLVKGPTSAQVLAKKSVALRWASDNKNLKALNDHAMQIAGRLAGGQVIPHAAALMKTPPAGLGKVETMAWDMFIGTRSADTQVTWGRLAEEQCKGFAALLKPLVTVKAKVAAR